MIESLIPAGTELESGMTVESNMLHRNKMQWGNNIGAINPNHFVVSQSISNHLKFSNTRKGLYIEPEITEIYKLQERMNALKQETLDTTIVTSTLLTVLTVPSIKITEL